MTNIEALIALFGENSTVSKKTVSVFKGVLTLDKELKKELKKQDPVAYDNVLAFLDDAEAYFGNRNHTKEEEALLKRLLPKTEVKTKTIEDPVPAPTVPKTQRKPSSIALASAVAKMAADKMTTVTQKTTADAPSPPIPALTRTTALQSLFDRTSKNHTSAMIAMIGELAPLTREEKIAVGADVATRIAYFLADKTSFIEGIDDTTRADLSDDERKCLKTLLHQVHIKSSPVAAISSAIIVVRNPRIPNWIRVLHANPLYKVSRQKIEEAFQNKKNSDPLIRANGRKHFDAWKLHARECFQSCSGPTYVNFGDHLLRCIRDLENGADPNSPEYIDYFVNT